MNITLHLNLPLIHGIIEIIILLAWWFLRRNQKIYSIGDYFGSTIINGFVSLLAIIATLINLLVYVTLLYLTKP